MPFTSSRRKRFDSPCLDTLHAFAESSGRARALVLALLLSRDDAICARQMKYLEKSLSPADLGIVRDTQPVAEALQPMLRLLRCCRFSRSATATDRGSAGACPDRRRPDPRRCACRRVLSFASAHLLATLLRDEIEARTPHGTASLEAGAADIQVLFSTLARFGAPDERVARMAYEAGMQAVFPMHRPPYVVIDDWATRFGEALRELEKLHPFAKKAVIEGLVKTIAHDDTLSVSEAELLRTVCASLHCPLPPLLPGLIPERSSSSSAGRLAAGKPGFPCRIVRYR